MVRVSDALVYNKWMLADMDSSQVNFICGKFEDAAKDYSESIKLDDAFVYAYIQLGVAQYKSGSTDASTATFNRALSLFPHSSDLHNYYGELLADQQKLPEALEMFTKAIELDSSSPLPYVNKAMLMYQSVGDVKQAIDLCKKALDGMWDDYLCGSPNLHTSCYSGSRV